VDDVIGGATTVGSGAGVKAVKVAALISSLCFDRPPMKDPNFLRFVVFFADPSLSFLSFSFSFSFFFSFLSLSSSLLLFVVLLLLPPERVFHSISILRFRFDASGTLSVSSVLAREGVGEGPVVVVVEVSAVAAAEAAAARSPGPKAAGSESAPFSLFNCSCCFLRASCRSFIALILLSHWLSTAGGAAPTLAGAPLVVLASLAGSKLVVISTCGGVIVVVSSDIALATPCPVPPCCIDMRRL